jgi:hydroxymethylpyrimidine kinase/phosphomethylpyrimidine kinase
MSSILYSALTIAGSDPCGGAGIQADLKTFQACGVYGMAVVTALTVQNSTGVKSPNPVEPVLVEQQLDFLLQDIIPDAIKTGMLGNHEIVGVVAEQVKKHDLKNVVVDTVINATDNTPLLVEKGVIAMKEKLLPLATVATPNINEAAVLCGFEVTDMDSMIRAAEEIHKLGVQFAIVTGGHMSRGEQAVDVLYDGTGHHFLPGHRLPGKENVHGSGCIFSAALAAHLAKGADILEAAKQAKEFVFRALQSAQNLGKGRPLPDTIQQ